MARGKRQDTDVHLPNGSIVYWSRRQRIDGRYLIPVRCGKCGKERIVNSCGLHGEFTGLCPPCGHLERRKVSKGSPQTLPNGSTIHWDREYSRDGIRWVPVQCGGPFCGGVIRDVPVYTTYPDSFTGQCRRCSHAYDRSGRWAGGRKKSPDGYNLVRLMPDHPFYSMTFCDGYIFEHRLIMAEKIGRPLRKGEIVHHINGIKDDNRPENLQLLVRDQYHAGYRPQDTPPHSQPASDRVKRRLCHPFE